MRKKRQHLAMLKERYDVDKLLVARDLEPDRDNIFLIANENHFKSNPVEEGDLDGLLGEDDDSKDCDRVDEDGRKIPGGEYESLSVNTLS